MASYDDDAAMSELEREFELEMQEEPGGAGDLEAAFEQLSDRGDDGDGEAGRSDDGDTELVPEESGEDNRATEFADRLYEIAQKDHESDSDADAAVHRVMAEMETDYFLGGLLKRGVGKLVNVAKTVAKKHPAFGVFKTLAKTVGGPLTGQLGRMGLSALLGAHPAGAALMPALKALGFEAGQDADANRQAWTNFVGFSREAYEHLADTVTEQAVSDPKEAARLAANAVGAAMRGSTMSGPTTANRRRTGGETGRQRRCYRIRVPRSQLGRGLVIKVDVQ